MNTNLQTVEWVWLDEVQSVTLPELARACGISTADVDELLEYGALQPLPTGPSEADQRLFSADCVTRLRTASKLRLEFDLDLFAVALLLDHLQRIETLERQVRSLEAQLPTRH
ncbi:MULTISPECIES: chaperone modulator CbpM [Comamonadaceae]|jgi:chaperone modulatory protein CbpM|uniref:chaperone modulator CbpM n=1 Tax=Comamonadaceae TaxID=80864 RepID=UPI002720760D|nr:MULTISPECIES: chaperone modulator CbpM [Comamonadaceae]MDO9253215.1 chaperone modulator CbpM [Hydrogenophaga sp.]MDP2440180.1 chaperone modulator CbpM [Rhodoferax sp.]MDP3323736.1 chaperone modulator CbpM [Hydrogenophaga sp.]MDP3884349.1 chaperone modulator CbpM [Hydrogenophaga sp.]MDZ4174333.1 chaperone modulator CbpM [Hydrogenophaga sp.]